jgi:hypothetical protein
MVTCASHCTQAEEILMNAVRTLLVADFSENHALCVNIVVISSVREL